MFEKFLTLLNETGIAGFIFSVQTGDSFLPDGLGKLVNTQKTGVNGKTYEDLLHPEIWWERLDDKTYTGGTVLTLTNKLGEGTRRVFDCSTFTVGGNAVSFLF